jgi:hypothetical protein
LQNRTDIRDLQIAIVLLDLLLNDTADFVWSDSYHCFRPLLILDLQSSNRPGDTAKGHRKTPSSGQFLQRISQGN